MPMELFTTEQRSALLENGRRKAAGEEIDPVPVVKLFTPDANATWLLSEIDPENEDLAFGLSDLGLGCPELGYVCLTELRMVRGKLGLPIERDLFFRAETPLSTYAADARQTGRVRA